MLGRQAAQGAHVQERGGKGGGRRTQHVLLGEGDTEVHPGGRMHHACNLSQQPKPRLVRFCSLITHQCIQPALVECHIEGAVCELQYTQKGLQ